MCSLRKIGGSELIWDANPQYWPRHAPNLFPIVGKLKNQQYQFENRTYHLNQHGFLRDLETQRIPSAEHELIFELVSTEETRQQYPFDFKLHVVFQLIENLLRTKYICFNEGSSNLYFSVGAHPAFKISENTQSIRIPKYAELDCYQLHEGCIKKEPVTRMRTHEIPLSPDLFDRDALIFKETSNTDISIQIDVHQVTLNTGNMPFLGIWSKPGAPFICIEPWSGLADIENHNGELITKEGIIEVAPMGSCEHYFDIIVE